MENEQNNNVPNQNGQNNVEQASSEGSENEQSPEEQIVPVHQILANYGIEYWANRISSNNNEIHSLSEQINQIDNNIHAAQWGRRFVEHPEEMQPNNTAAFIKSHNDIQNNLTYFSQNLRQYVRDSVQESKRECMLEINRHELPAPHEAMNLEQSQLPNIEQQLNHLNQEYGRLKQIIVDAVALYNNILKFYTTLRIDIQQQTNQYIQNNARYKDLMSDPQTQQWYHNMKFNKLCPHLPNCERKSLLQEAESRVQEFEKHNEWVNQQSMFNDPGVEQEKQAELKARHIITLFNKPLQYSELTKCIDYIIIDTTQCNNRFIRSLKYSYNSMHSYMLYFTEEYAEEFGTHLMQVHNSWMHNHIVVQMAQIGQYEARILELQTENARASEAIQDIINSQSHNELHQHHEQSQQSNLLQNITNELNVENEQVGAEVGSEDGSEDEPLDEGASFDFSHFSSYGSQ